MDLDGWLVGLLLVYCWFTVGLLLALLSSGEEGAIKGTFGITIFPRGNILYLMGSPGAIESFPTNFSSYG